MPSIASAYIYTLPRYSAVRLTKIIEGTLYCSNLLTLQSSVSENKLCTSNICGVSNEYNHFL